VLRLLFAKINSATGRVYRPPGSAASDPGQRDTYDDVIDDREHASARLALPSSLQGLGEQRKRATLGVGGPFGLSAPVDVDEDEAGEYDDGDD
jgi:hypothetical protein